MRPEAIGPVLSLRAARAHRAVVSWVEHGGELHDVPVEIVQRAVAARAEELRRDLSVEEVESIAVGAVDEYEQREAERTIASARSEQADKEREQYLAKQAERYRLLADEPRRG